MEVLLKMNIVKERLFIITLEEKEVSDLINDLDKADWEKMKFLEIFRKLLIKKYDED